MLSSIIRSKINKDYDKTLIARINEIAEDRIPIAKVPGTHFKVYLKATILNDFNYLEFMLIGPSDLKTMGGCTLTFKSKESEYVLQSESDIIECDYSNISSIGITLIDTDLEDDFDAFIKANTLTEIRVDCKVGQVFKKAVSLSYTEIDSDCLLTSILPIQAVSSGTVTSPGGGSSLGI